MLLGLVLSFPLLLMFGFGVLYVASGRDERVFAGPVGLLFYLALLALPCGAVLWLETGRVGAALRVSAFTPAWSLAGLAVGAALWALQQALPGRTPDAGKRAWVGPPGKAGFLLVLAPVTAIVLAEEIVWRAYLLPETNLVVSAAAFALHHYAFGWRHVLFSFLTGLAWGALFLLGDLWASITSHLAYNILAWRHMRRVSRSC